jgi:hypothetical protein
VNIETPQARVYQLRLMFAISPHVRSGCDQLLGQIFNLGVEAHDDLRDGLVWLLQGLVSQGSELPKIHWIEA